MLAEASTPMDRTESMFQMPKNRMHAPPEYQALLRAAGLSAESVFTNPQIKPWRVLPDRENCTLDLQFEGQPVRLHVKRYKPERGFKTPAQIEYQGIAALAYEKIPTADLVAWGVMLDHRSFVILKHLDGYTAADKLIQQGTPFDKLLIPTADLAAKLHMANLHHRDLYLCHFLAKPDGDAIDLRLIDAARVARLDFIFTRGRWIVKDLAQFWYSTTKLPITDAQRDAWLKRYAEQRGLPGYAGLKKAILRKVARIARHDAKLNASQPKRNISIPT